MSQETGKPTPQDVIQQTQIGLVRDGDHQVTIWKRENVLLVQIEHHNHIIASLAVPTVVYDASQHPMPIEAVTVPTQNAAIGQETPPPAEASPIATFQGYAGRNGVYRQSKTQKGAMEFYMPVYYRPKADTRKSPYWDQVVIVNVFAFGEHADAINALNIHKGQAVEVTGENHSHKGKKDEDKNIYQIHATRLKIMKQTPINNQEFNTQLSNLLGLSL